MGRKLRYLTLEDRETIERLHKGGAPAAVIAATVKVHQATIYRELPNGYTYTGPPDKDGRPTPTVDEYGRRVYNAKVAQRTFEQNIKRRGKRARAI